MENANTGAFNPLSEEFSSIWKQCAAENRIPDKGEIADALKKMTRPTWRIDNEYEMVERRQEAKLSLNGIAKGYILDKACKVALNASDGVDNVMISIGGDICVTGSGFRRVGVSNPFEPQDNAAPLIELQLQDQSVATSASYARGFDIQNNHFSHIIDPRTGYPISGTIKSATVISDTASQSDALATAMMVLSPEEGIKLIESLKATECILVLKENTLVKSSGIDSLVYKEPGHIMDNLASVKGFDLKLEIEINHPESSRYHRPYLAIWVEDDDDEVVKTVCLWMELGSSWVKKLSRWSRLDYIDAQTIRAVTKATRMPGRYSFIWDGTSDSGESLPTGTYTLFIEAVREKGTHQLIREKIVLGSEEFIQELKENIEIRSATIVYTPVKEPDPHDRL